MSTSGILDNVPASQYPYATPEQPNHLTDDALAFLSEYTGQKDLGKLREHVLQIWKNAKETLWVYRCIQEFMFLQPRISKHPFYEKAKTALLTDKDKHILDIGCCFGQDTRQMILNGIPQSSIKATDITPQYWELGKKLFMDADSLSVETAWGSFTDPEYISSGPLSPMKSKAAFAWAGAVLHVLTAEDVRMFIAHVHAMLAPGGTLFGTCVGQDPPGEWAETPTGKGKRYLHREDTLEALLKEAGYTKISIERDVSRGVLERQEDISSLGDQKIIMIFAATK